MKTIIIAEAGVNHNGDYNLALKLIDKAVEAGVDYVKFQTFKSEKLVSKNAKQADYQKKNLGKETSQFEMLKKLELDVKAHEKLISYSKQKGIKFLSTAFDLDSIDFLASFNLDYWKIPSGEITNYPYLKKIGKFNGNIILSTGMANYSEIEAALNTFILAGTKKDKITVLHTNTQYPTPMKDANLSAMNTIKETFKVNVGYSDHTLGIEAPIAAVAMGATIIEKHFTLDKAMEGPDHKASLNPVELKQMVAAIRNIEVALGDGIKRPSESERVNMSAARKSIIAAVRIKKGDTLSEENLTVKRPGTGISPMQWKNVTGTIAVKDFDEDELIIL